MKIWNSMLAAFGMYSRLPVKNVNWEKENICYTLCFVPMIGILVGVAQYYIWLFCQAIQGGTVLFACLFPVIPIVITGGIHMDGFCDTVDALASFRIRERRLEILKDPHIGSFAVLGCCCYFLLQAGFAAVICKRETMWIVCIAPVLSRCLGCLMAVCMRNARREGTLFTFTNGADKTTCAAALAVVTILVAGLAVGMEPLCAMFLLLGLVLAMLYCIIMAKKNFGGVTGDIIGFSVQVMELAGVVMAAVGGMLWSL